MLRDFRNFVLLAALSCNVSHCTAQDATSKELSRVLKGRVEISRDKDMDIIVIKGHEDDVQKAEQVIKKLERQPELVHINVTFAVSDTETGKNKIVDELKLVTLDNSQSSLSFAQEVSVTVGTTQSRTGSARHAIRERQNVGTIVKVTPKVAENGIYLSLYAEKSWMDTSTGSNVSDGEVSDVAPPSTFASTAESTLYVATGESQTIQALVSGGTESGRVLLITVSASTESQMASRSVQRNNPQRSAASDGSTPRKVTPVPRTNSTSQDRSPGGASRGGRGGAAAGRSSSRSRAGSAASSESPSASDQVKTNFAESLFKKLDKNTNGKLDEKEAKSLPTTLRSVATPGQTSEQFVENFNEYLAKRAGSRKSESKE